MKEVSGNGNGTADYENAIEIQGLTKKYDGFTLDNVSFAVPRGTIMGFVGQNGAGKTTTIKAVLNIIRTDGGSVRILGMDHIEKEYEIKEQIAAVFDEIPFQDCFNAVQLNRVFEGLYVNWSSETFFSYLDRFQLPRRKKIRALSKGMKMKLQIATALSHGAKVLIMDEATTGLDPVVRNEILDIFREYLKDDTNSILMSSHITSDLEKIADAVTFIDKGKVYLTGYKDELLERHALLKCSRKEFETVARQDYISARVGEYNVEVMVADREAAHAKYPDIACEKTTLEEIMLFYVNREKGEWS